MKCVTSNSLRCGLSIGYKKVNRRGSKYKLSCCTNWYPPKLEVSYRSSDTQGKWSML